MDPLQQLMIKKMMMGSSAAPVPNNASMSAGIPKVPTVPPAPTYLPDVAQNIGQDKLAKHPYNPYGLLTINPQTNPDAMPSSKDEKFTQEMLKDSRE